MQIEPFFDPRTSTLTYVVFDDVTHDAVVIDPVLDFEPANGKLWTESLERVAAFLTTKALRLHLVLETHVHADHLSGSQWLKTRFGGKVAVSHRITEVQDTFKGVFGWASFPADGRQFDLLLQAGQDVHAGALTFKALPTPGHTPACMSFLIGDAVFTGDALFLPDLGVGRCDFPKGSVEALWNSITGQLYTLPDTSASSSVTTTRLLAAPGRPRAPSALSGRRTCNSRRTPRKTRSSRRAPRATAPSARLVCSSPACR